MAIRFFCLFLIFWGFSITGQEYDFCGQHLIASYYGCDKKALTDSVLLEKKMLEATQKTKATVLSYTKEKFPGDGFSMVILVSESHSSIHTYPEYDACFIDIFTCGTTCQVKHFDEVLRSYLKPKKVNLKIFNRN